MENVDILVSKKNEIINEVARLFYNQRRESCLDNYWNWFEENWKNNNNWLLEYCEYKPKSKFTDRIGDQYGEYFYRPNYVSKYKIDDIKYLPYSKENLEKIKASIRVERLAVVEDAEVIRREGFNFYNMDSRCYENTLDDYDRLSSLEQKRYISNAEKIYNAFVILCKNYDPIEICRAINDPNDSILSGLSEENINKLKLIVPSIYRVIENQSKEIDAESSVRERVINEFHDENQAANQYDNLDNYLINMYGASSSVEIYQVIECCKDRSYLEALVNDYNSKQVIGYRVNTQTYYESLIRLYYKKCNMEKYINRNYRNITLSDLKGLLSSDSLKTQADRFNSDLDSTEYYVPQDSTEYYVTQEEYKNSLIGLYLDRYLDDLFNGKSYDEINSNIVNYDKSLYGNELLERDTEEFNKSTGFKITPHNYYEGVKRLAARVQALDELSSEPKIL